MADPVTPVIVSAVGTMAASDSGSLGEALIAAQSVAVEEALARGVDIHDSVALLSAKRKACVRVLDSWGLV